MKYVAAAAGASAVGLFVWWLGTLDWGRLLPPDLRVKNSPMYTGE